MDTAGKSILHQLLRRPAAVVALSIIAITYFIAVFAYVLAPDNSPMANTMIIELGARPPGFKKDFLLLPRSTATPHVGKLSEWFNGTPAAYKLVPVNGYYFAGSNLIAVHYVDEGLADTISYPISSLLPATAIPAGNTQQYITEHNITSRTFYLGTDRYGRDILSRLLIGSRVTISVGLVAVLLSVTIGIFLGALAGYYGGITDSTVMLVINVIHAIPTLLLVFAITLSIGKGFVEIFIAIGLSMWVGTARLVRGQAMVIRELEYVSAAKVIGLSNTRIIFRHILPNIAGPVMVVAAGNFAAAILTEAGLSFLGFGVQPPQPSWGLMIKEHYNFLLTNRPLLALIPGIAIMLLVYAFNILGNALRDILDVR